MKGAMSVVAAAALATTVMPASAADKFRQLKGREITARFSGMEFTDEVHWAQVFGKGGRLSTFSMGKATTGTWRVHNDELCWDENGRGSRCYQVWMSGKSQSGLDIYDEGVLRKPQARDQR